MNSRYPPPVHDSTTRAELPDDRVDDFVLLGAAAVYDDSHPCDVLNDLNEVPRFNLSISVPVDLTREVEAYPNAASVACTSSSALW